MVKNFKPFTWHKIWDLSQFWRPKLPSLVTNYHKFGVVSTKTRVESHVDSWGVTLDTKYDQITIPWQPQPHFSEIIHPMVKIRGFKSRFLMSWCDSEHQICEIKYFYIRDLNFGKVSMICLYLSRPFVIDRLRVFLVQPPVIWSLHHFGPQNRYP